MEPYHRGMGVELYCGHVLDVLGSLPAGSVQTCVTSPPYWGLRDYGMPGVEWPEVLFPPMPGLELYSHETGPLLGIKDVRVSEWTGCLGLEPEPMAFVGHLVAIFREVRRVLRPDGTCWINLGDSFAGGGPHHGEKNTGKSGTNRGSVSGVDRTNIVGIPPKNLLGIPWRVAFALQADGWWLRMDNIWAKPNPMPESVKDRPTKAHEYVFLLAKNPEYFYDADAIKEPLAPESAKRYAYRFGGAKAEACTEAEARSAGSRTHPIGERQPGTSRNKRSVWTITPKPYRGAHFATMPPDLARTCILAGSRPGDMVLDPFNGAGTTGLAARESGRCYVGAELNEDYCRLSIERWRQGCARAPFPLDVA